MGKLLAIIFFLISFSVSGQDITGVWTGYIQTPGSQLEFELAIDNGNKGLSGYSLLIYLKEGIENIGMKKAKIRRTKNKIYFEDGELIYDNYTTQPRRVKMFGNVRLTKKDTLLVLQGNFSTRSLDFRDMRTYSGEVYLEKTNRPLTSKVLVTMDELNFVHNLSFMKTKQPVTKKTPPGSTQTTGHLAVTKQELKPTERKIEVVKEIVFSSDSLQLNFYDNGTVDGDTISMVLNGKVIADKIMLTTNAFRMMIPAKINIGDSLILVIHAESLGLIPPNTGLLIIQDGNNRHEIRFEGDMQRSSAVILKRK